MIGELAEINDFQSYIKPVPVSLEVTDFVEMDFFGEVSIELDRDGEFFSALVPIRVFDKASRTVVGLAIGQNSNTKKVLVRFAPTQNGQANLELPEPWLSKLAVSS